jgi:hypothetical protein
MKLHIADNLALPLDAVTQTFAILAKRRVGKTYTASVMAEEFCKHKLPFVVLFPNTLTRDELAERSEYSVASGHVDNSISALRTRELITGHRGALMASEEFFVEA